MDFTRQRDIFDPGANDTAATIVGCGGIGSFTAFALAKLGIKHVSLVDFDTVGEENIPNQLFTPDQIGKQKVYALAETIVAATGAPLAALLPQPLQDGVPLSPVVISALDSMSARAELWSQVKYKLQTKLFIDGRIGGQHIVVYCVKPNEPDDIAGYESTLHSDEEGLDLPCTGRAVIDVGFAIASLITRAVRAHFTDESISPMVYLNQQTMELHKGGWTHE